MTACTPKEEVEWRTRLSRPVKDSFEPREPSCIGSLDLDVKSLGTVFGKPGWWPCAAMDRRKTGVLTVDPRHHCSARVDSPGHHGWAEITSVPSRAEEHEHRAGSHLQRLGSLDHQPLAVSPGHACTNFCAVASSQPARTPGGAASRRLEPRGSPLSRHDDSGTERTSGAGLSIDSDEEAQRCEHHQLLHSKIW